MLSPPFGLLIVVIIIMWNSLSETKPMMKIFGRAPNKTIYLTPATRHCTGGPYYKQNKGQMVFSTLLLCQ